MSFGIYSIRQDKSPTLHTICRISGLLSAILTVLIGIFKIFTLKPRLFWPDPNFRYFWADVNKAFWRDVAFSFSSGVLIDTWFPFIVGVISLLLHFETTKSLFYNSILDVLLLLAIIPMSFCKSRIFRWCGHNSWISN